MKRNIIEKKLNKREIKGLNNILNNIANNNISNFGKLILTTVKELDTNIWEFDKGICANYKLILKIENNAIIEGMSINF